MPRHLGRLKIVTKRKEGTCNYALCEVNKDRKVLPGEKVFILTKQGMIGTRTTIFYKQYHETCFVAWAMWTFNKTPLSKDGRIGMKDLPSKDKQERQRLVRNKAQLLRDLRTTSGDKLLKLTDRIHELDKKIGKTGYPVLQYRGRKSESKLAYDKFWQEVKDHYQHPLRVPKAKSEEAERLGMGEQFSKDMKEWFLERQQATIERQGKDYEAGKEDGEVEY
jgi:hypothetical protein